MILNHPKNPIQTIKFISLDRNVVELKIIHKIIAEQKNHQIKNLFSMTVRCD